MSSSNPTGRFAATVLFCDIRGFTAMFDQRDPIEALTFANAVLGELGAVVEASGGTIDKFTGDGFLAHFGITTGDRDHADRACRCSLRLRAALTRINTGRYVTRQPVIGFGIGIHSGVVAAGTISARHKSEYTVMGSVVNLASRIEGLTRYFAIDCLMSEDTAALLESGFKLRSLPPRPVRGVADRVKTMWLLPTNREPA